MFCNSCGKKIDKDAVYCPQCGEKIIETKGLPLVKDIATEIFIFLDITTLGFYGFFWLLSRFKALNALCTSDYNKISVAMIIFRGLLPISTIYHILNFNNETPLAEINLLIFSFLLLCQRILSLKIIKIIESYAVNNKKKLINHNLVCLEVFGLWYSVLAIETFEQRLSKAKYIYENKSI